MKTIALSLLILVVPQLNLQAAPCVKNKNFTLLVHGGAGAPKEAAKRKQQLQVIKKVLSEGHQYLLKGGTAVGAVEKAIVALEDSPFFNAGRGAIANKRGEIELDSSIMRGQDLNAGSVAAVKKVKNPIKAARAAMEKSNHVMFVGPGADEFAQKQGLETKPQSYFKTARFDKNHKKYFGTVGAVVLDRCGNLAAGTSTGGYETKTPGRVGDSPIIGAGTYAQNNVCAVSATGYGEFFIRYAAAHRICSLMEYKNFSPQKAADEVIHKLLKPAGGPGGIIVLDSKGQPTWSYSSEALTRGYVDQNGISKAGHFKEMKKL